MSQIPEYEQLEVYLNGQWVDLSDRVQTNLQQLEAPAGRQTTLEEIQPSRLAAMLSDSDRWLTCGNPTSPYYPHWDQGAPIRWRTTIAGGTVGNFRGVLEMPQSVISFAELDDDDDAGIYCSITAVDRLTQLDRAPAFLSTLAEHVRYHGGSSLAVFLPMNESSGRTLSDPRQAFSLVEGSNYFSGSTPAEFHPLVRYGAATPPPADQLAGVIYDPVTDATTATVVWAEHSGDLPAPLVVDSGNTVVVACWVNFQRAGADGQLISLNGPGGCYMELGVDGTLGTWRASVEDFSGLVGPTTGQAYNVDAWRLVALRLTEPSGVVEFWNHGADPVVSTIAGATSSQLTSLTILGQAMVAMELLQVYFGAGVYTREMHLAQVRAGFTGLDRQSVDDRIRTVARYAGVTDAELDLEVSPTVMPTTALAGLRPGAVMRAAAAADTGPLFSNGDGEIVFQSRTHRYNV